MGDVHRPPPDRFRPLAAVPGRPARGGSGRVPARLLRRGPRRQLRCRFRLGKRPALPAAGEPVLLRLAAEAFPPPVSGLHLDLRSAGAGPGSSGGRRGTAARIAAAHPFRRRRDGQRQGRRGPLLECRRRRRAVVRPRHQRPLPRRRRRRPRPAARTRGKRRSDRAPESICAATAARARAACTR